MVKERKERMKCIGRGGRDGRGRGKTGRRRKR